MGEKSREHKRLQEEKSRSVVFGSTRSPWTFIPYGLPQGSVLAPLLYILYTADLSDILTLKGVSAHQYADDTQAFAHGPASTAASLVVRVLEATTTLDLWMSSNRLRLNSDKTQFIWLGGRAQLAKIDMDFSALLSQTSTTLSQFGIWALAWIQFSHFLTMSIASLEHAFIIYAKFAPSVTHSLLTRSTLSSMH